MVDQRFTSRGLALPSLAGLLMVASVSSMAFGQEPEPLAEAPPVVGSSLVELHRALAEPVPSTQGVRVASDLTLDVYTIRLDGVLFPLDMPNGERESDGAETERLKGWYFRGQGRHVLKPVTNGEWRSLYFRSGIDDFKQLETEFTEALIWLDATAARSIVADSVAPAAVATSVAPPNALDAQRLMEVTHGSSLVDLPLRIAAAMRNQTAVQAGEGIAYLLTNSEDPGPTLVAFDQRGVLDGEEVALYVFERDGEPEAPEDAAADSEDQEVWSDPGYWYSSRDIPAIRAGSEFGEGPEQLFDVETVTVRSVISTEVDLEGEATIVANVLATKVTVVPFELTAHLRVKEAFVRKGEQAVAVPFVQATPEEGVAVALLLDEPLLFGDRVEILLRYAGDKVLVDDGVRTYRVGARASWYPNFDDLAHFDLTFEVPKGNTVIAVGEPKGSRTQDGKVVSHWRTKTPIRVAGFNYGSFKEYLAKEENTGYQLAVYASLGVPDIITEINGAMRQQSAVMTPDQAVAIASSGITLISQYSGATDLGVSLEGLAQSALADAQNSVQVFTARFGPSPFDRLAITQQAEWTFGQAWPGLIYLPYAAAFGTQARAMLGLSGMAEFIDEVGIHEIAHQWWGHLIGWKSYRDQWISEGFAEFSAALVVEATGGQEAYDAFWRSRRRNVLARRFGSAPPAWAGPMTLGYRASSAKSPYGYQGLAYGKGGFVLHMLRDLMRDVRVEDPDAAFFTMMRDFAQSYAGQEVSTADFQRTVQKHFVPQLNAAGDGKVDWFFDQWVYGRSIPTIHSELEWESAGRGKYRVYGTVSQSNVPEDFVSVVSFYADLGKDGVGMFGRSAFRGEMTRNIDTVVELSRKPKALMVNHRNGVLAYDN